MSDIVENWDHPIDLHESMDLYQLVQVPLIENRRIELEIEEIYDDRFLDTASGAELEKIGQLVGAKRKTSEGDEKFRKRIQGEFAAQASDTTYESFASAMLSILDANASDVDIRTPPDTAAKVVEVEIDGAILDQNPLSKSELNELLDKTVSAGARVDIKVTGTFAFAGDNSALEGWDEGTWSSTV